MNNRKNKTNTNRRKRNSNNLFGIKNIEKVFMIGEGENRRSVKAKVWTVYEKSSGNQLAVGSFSQMMEIFSVMDSVDPAKVVTKAEAT